MSSGRDLESTLFWMFCCLVFSAMVSETSSEKTEARVSMLCSETQTSPGGLHSLPATPAHLNNSGSISGSPCVGAGLAGMVPQCCTGDLEPHTAGWGAVDVLDGQPDSSSGLQRFLLTKPTPRGEDTPKAYKCVPKPRKRSHRAPTPEPGDRWRV